MAEKVRAKKLFLGVKDDRFDNRRQSSIISLLTDGNEIYLNQYGKMFTSDEVGNFDIKKINEQAILEFLPIDGRNNEYTYTFVSYDTKQNISSTDYYDFGNTINIKSTHSTIGIGSSESLFTISDKFTSAKLLVEISSNTSRDYEYNEINLISDGNEIYFSEFGRITLSDDTYRNSVGLGTYGVVFSGTSQELIFYSNTSTVLESNVIGVSIANTNFTATTSRGLRYADIKSVNIGIASSSSPVPETISLFTSNYNFGYFIIQITDTTNNEMQLSEVIVLSDNSTSTLIEYGNVYTNSPLGSFDSSTASITELLFTPNENIDVDITLLHHATSYVPFLSFPVSINFSNSELTTGLSKFDESSDINLKKDFNLTHKEVPIFERVFNGSLESTSINPSSVDIDRNLIYLPDHFFVSGEKVNYRSDSFYYVNILSTQASITSGVGTDIIYIDSLVDISNNDFFNSQSQGPISITAIGTTFVSLASTINSEVISGSAVTFSRLFESDLISSVSAIGIAQTYISGIGVTNKMSGDLYIYKFDSKFVGLCTSPADALSSPPKLINITSVGIGNNHYLTSSNPNSKCIILIDNVIQSPIVSTAITAKLESSLELIDTTVEFSGITSFFSGNLIKIDDEIMKIASVGVGSTTFVEVKRSFMGTGISTHSTNSQITKLNGNYNIIGSKIYFADAPYGPIYDEVNGDINIRSTFQGRAFIRSGIPNTNKETYQDNYIFDDISSRFDAVTKDFILKSNGDDISGFSTSNSIVLINNIFQNPEDDFNLSEDLSNTELNFTGTATSSLYDPNNASVPRGGIIISVGSSNGFGFQPLVAAGGTAIVSTAGTIQSISIGNSGSGYRSGIQPIVRVGVQTFSDGVPNIEFIGTATVTNGNVVSVAITNPGFGYTFTQPPDVIFEDPLSYSDLDLIYHNPITGIGSQAKIDIVVGQGSSIIDFKIKNYGYSYNIGDILTIETGGITGIPTDPTLTFNPFLLTVERIYTDNFSGWSIGELQKLDDINSLFNGVRKKFPISDNGNRFAILAKSGSEIDLKAVLLIFINDVLQEPGVSYNFDGGSNIEFVEAPKSRDKCKILFYKGTPEIDVIDVDILETIKVGDILKITGDKFNLTENKRLVRDIILPDVVETSPYNSIGITSDLNLLRSVTWCRQRDDIIIDGVEVNKSRIRYELNIFPVSNIIQSVGIGTTQIYVDSIKSIFDPTNENTTNDIINKVEIIDNSTLISAIGTALVSTAGTIQSISVINGGVGYTTAPSVSIQNPVGLGTSGKSELLASLSGDSVSSISVISPGFGYTNTNPPLVFIEPPVLKKEYIDGVSYIGDYGFISGIKTASVGFASTALIFDLYIPQNSYLRNSLVTNPTVSQSQIQENYYFKVSNSSIGSGVTSLRGDGSIIGIGTTGIDNIYQVISVSTASTDVYGVGSVSVTQVTVSVSSYDGISGLGYSSYYGDYSWGIVETSNVTKNYDVSENYGVVGLNSTPIVRRYYQLRTQNYTNI